MNISSKKYECQFRLWVHLFCHFFHWILLILVSIFNWMALSNEDATIERRTLYKCFECIWIVPVALCQCTHLDSFTKSKPFEKVSEYTMCSLSLSIKKYKHIVYGSLSRNEKVWAMDSLNQILHTCMCVVCVRCTLDIMMSMEQSLTLHGLWPFEYSTKDVRTCQRSRANCVNPICKSIVNKIAGSLFVSRHVWMWERTLFDANDKNVNTKWKTTRTLLQNEYLSRCSQAYCHFYLILTNTYRERGGERRTSSYQAAFDQKTLRITSAVEVIPFSGCVL